MTTSSSSVKLPLLGKQPMVISALSKLARELGPGAKLPTSRSLASSLKVTKATLARSLAYLQDRKVLICRQGSGIYVAASAAQKRVALVFGSESLFSPQGSPFGMLMVQECSRRANRMRERFSFYIDTPGLNGSDDGNAVPAHQDLVDDLKAGKIDGIILIARNSAAEEAWLRQQGVPFVGTDEPAGAGSAVIWDYDALITEGIERLGNAGCRTLGSIGVLNDHGAKFEKAMHASGLVCKSHWISTPLPTHEYGVELHEKLGRDLAEQWLKACRWDTAEADLPDGLLVTDDIMAKGVLQQFDLRGLEVGKDIQLCSHANKGSFALSEWEDAILRVEFDPKEIAVAIFDMLEALIDGKPQGVRYIRPIQTNQTPFNLPQEMEK